MPFLILKFAGILLSADFDEEGGGVIYHCFPGLDRISKYCMYWKYMIIYVNWCQDTEPSAV